MFTVLTKNITCHSIKKLVELKNVNLAMMDVFNSSNSESISLFLLNYLILFPKVLSIQSNTSVNLTSLKLEIRSRPDLKFICP